MRLHIHWVGFLLLLSVGTAFSQESNPYVILDSLKEKIEQVHDYRADIEIEVDVDFINIPVKHATMIYKAPDKVKFRSEGFFMVPKKGINMPVREIMDQPYSAIYVGDDTLSGRLQHVIKVVPMTKKPDIILSTWWIDQETTLLSRSESSTRDEGTFTVDFSYDDPALPLPTQMEISFEIEKINLPMKFIGKTQGLEFEKKELEPGESYTGKVIVRFSGIQINTNPPDKEFEEDKN